MRTSVPNLPQTRTEKKLHVSVPGTELVSEDFSIKNILSPVPSWLVSPHVS